VGGESLYPEGSTKTRGERDRGPIANATALAEGRGELQSCIPVEELTAVPVLSRDPSQKY